MAETVVRVRVVFTGRVQGVGFRASCRAVAEAEGVCGWVRNEADGTVRAEFEGPAGAVDRVLGRVPRATWGRVDGVERARIGVEGACGFEIRR